MVLLLGKHETILIGLQCDGETFYFAIIGHFQHGACLRVQMHSDIIGSN